MQKKKLTQKKWFRVLLLIILATALGLFIAELKMITYHGALFGPEFLDLNIHFITLVYLWGLLVFVIYIISRYFPFNEEKWKISLPVNLILCLIIAVVHCYLNYFASTFINNFRFGFSYTTVEGVFKTYYRYNLLIYWVIMGFFLSVDYYRKYKKREREAFELSLRTSKLESQLAKAQLQSLKTQLQPHFLFNTLHTVSGLMNKDISLAKKTIALLSDLLRISLDMKDRQEIRFKEELEFVNKYLELQRTRFKDRLKIEMEIQPETLDASVPTLLLQPITENAVTHGISPHKKPGILKIVSKKIDENFIVEVHDSGDGIDSKTDTENSNGIGISNTRERLKQLYAENHSFELTGSPMGGLLVRIKFPFKKFEEPDK
ncbi:sensor histidine kinase [candidate division KSB1 bacterium]